MTPGTGQGPALPHPGYVGWAHEGDEVLDRAALEALVAAAPEGLYRIKGKVLAPDGAHEVHVVGQTVDIKPAAANRTTLVAIGLAGGVTKDEIAEWWAGR
jgi:hypothetical protein